MIKLRDPEGKKKFRMPVHINRLKMAYIRTPEPHPYLRHTSDDSSNTNVSPNTESSSPTEHTPEPVRLCRSCRNIQLEF